MKLPPGQSLIDSFPRFGLGGRPPTVPALPQVDIGGMSTLVLAPMNAANLKVRNFASAVLLSQPREIHKSLEDSGRVVDARAL